MALIFFSGFDTGDLFGWKSSAGSYSIQDSIKKTGTYALRANPASSYTQLFTPNYTPNRISFWFYIATTSDVLVAIAGRSTGLRIRLSTDGYLSLYDHEVLQDTGSTQLSLNTWYRISCSYSPSSNAAKLFINGIEELSVIGLSIGDGIGYEYGLKNIILDYTITTDVYFDNIVEDDTDSLEDLGDIRCAIALVNGAGNYAEFDSVYPAEASEIHYENIDGYPTDGNENWHDGSSSVKESYSIENCSEIGIAVVDTIKAVRTHCRMRAQKGGNQNILVRDNGVDSEVSFNVDSFATYQDRIDNIMPADSGSWTQDRFNALEVGMSINQTRKDPGILHVVVSVAFLFLGYEGSSLGVSSASGSLTVIAAAAEKKQKAAPALNFGASGSGVNSWDF